MDDETKKKVSKLRSNLAAKLAAAALLMTTGMSLRHPEDEREFIKREPIFKESANGSGDPPELLKLLNSTDYTSNYILNTAHAEETEDGIQVTAFDADDREIKYV